VTRDEAERALEESFIRTIEARPRGTPPPLLGLCLDALRALPPEDQAALVPAAWEQGRDAAAAAECEGCAGRLPLVPGKRPAWHRGPVGYEVCRAVAIRALPAPGSAQ
jgi:hypothetical protein